MLATTIFVIATVFCVVFLSIAWRVKGKASNSFAMYAIGGGALPLYLVLFSDLGAAMGAGNFMGHATSAYKVGMSHIPFILGEQGSKIVFALVFAGFAGRFAYKTISELMFDLLHRDKVSRMMTGLLTTTIALTGVAGQSKGLGYLFQQFTGLNPLPVIIVFNIVFVVYTCLGGIVSVVWTELIQGMVILVFGAIFYGFAFAPVHWSLTELGSRLTTEVGPQYWNLSGVPFWTVVATFITGCFGILADQAYWQRCFAAKDGRTARAGMLICGSIVIPMVMMTAFVGMTAKALNPHLDPALAMPWLMMNYTPLWVLAVVFSLVLAAAMSSASSQLNSAAILVVNDILQTLWPESDDRRLIVRARLMTVIFGLIAIVLAISSDSIIGLFAIAYTILGGSVVPVLIVGLLWKIKPKKFESGEKNSRLTPWGVRTAIVLGAIVSLSVGILWGIALSTVAAVLVSSVQTNLNNVLISTRS